MSSKECFVKHDTPNIMLGPTRLSRTIEGWTISGSYYAEGAVSEIARLHIRKPN